MDFTKENEELLESTESLDETDPNSIPKRGSKDELISKFFEISDKHQIACEHSVTTLKRMTKKKLAELLGDQIEKCMEKKLLEQVKLKAVDGSSSDQRNELLALGTLRLIHDTLSQVTERGVESFTPFSIEGFCTTLQDQKLQKEIDECLLAIAREMDVMQYISSPYVRLALCWSGAAANNLKKENNTQI